MATEDGVHLLSSKKRAQNKTSNYALTMNVDAKFDKEDDGSRELTELAAV